MKYLTDFTPNYIQIHVGNTHFFKVSDMIFGKT